MNKKELLAFLELTTIELLTTVIAENRKEIKRVNRKNFLSHTVSHNKKIYNRLYHITKKVSDNELLKNVSSVTLATSLHEFIHDNPRIYIYVIMDKLIEKHTHLNAPIHEEISKIEGVQVNKCEFLRHLKSYYCHVESDKLTESKLITLMEQHGYSVERTKYDTIIINKRD